MQRYVPWITIIILVVLVGMYLLLSGKGSNNQNPSTQQTMSTPNDQTDQVTASNSATSSATESATTATGSAITKPDGLVIEDIKAGSGKEVKSGDTVVMNYLGTLQNGTKFDSSYDRNQPFTTQIGVGQVIKGWDEGVPGMKVGGKRKLIIPPALAYGSQGIGSIPPNSTLIFEVELLDVK